MADSERWHDVARLYNAALEHDGDDRAAFLEEACAGDDALRKEVESLLSCDARRNSSWPSRPSRFCELDRPERQNVVGRTSARRTGRPLSDSRVVGRRRDGRRLSRRTERSLRRHVALKVIKLGLDTPSVVSRFEAERQALAPADHPNVAAVLDAGATEDGRPYFVMERCAGQPITDYCDSHRMSTRARLSSSPRFAALWNMHISEVSSIATSSHPTCSS